MNSKTLYLPGLNGIRAVGSIGVIGSHSLYYLDMFGLNPEILGVDLDGNAKEWMLGKHGLTMFFTLSGFLLTYILLKEKELQKVNVKQFYIRRFLRVGPLYYIFLAVALIFAAFFNMYIDWGLLPYYLFFAANIPVIFNVFLPFLIQYWSLATEIQFYLFIPFLARCSIRKMLWISLALIFVFMSFKLSAWYLYKFHADDLFYRMSSIFRFQTLFLGVAGAILFYQKNKWFLYITQSLAMQIICWIVVLLTILNVFHIASVIDFEIISFITICLIVTQITGKNRLISLENKILSFLGEISYSVYITHLLVIYSLGVLVGKFEQESPLNYVLVVALIYCSTFWVGYLSYRWIEKPFLKRKNKYSRVKSSAYAH